VIDTGITTFVQFGSEWIASASASTGTVVESEGQIETGKTRKRGRSLKTKYCWVLW
jgi:hypothetical protein